MSRNFLLGLVIMLLLPLQNFAQHRGVCATDQEALMERLERNKLAAEDRVDARATSFIPVTWHRIGRNDGTGKVSLTKIMDQMCRLNEDFAIVDFHFYIKNINEINSTLVYDNHRQAVNGIMRNARDEGAINIFVPNNANVNDDDLGLTLAYYDPPRDWLVTRKDQVDGISSTMPHEIGHFFSLPHPHRGWDAQPYEEGSGNAPSFSPGGTLTELQNGSNCEDAGDRICDTPPDYNLGFGWPSCNYTGNAKDPNGQAIDPQEINFMGYFLNCNRNDYIFTPMQIEIMQADLEHPSRNYLDNNVSPSTTELAKPTLLSPINDAETSSYDDITLEWQAVPGASSYLIEIDRLPTFAVNPIRVLVGGTSYKIEENLSPNKTYHWRVKAISRGSYCSARSASFKFKTGIASGFEELTLVDSYSVFPNPMSKGQNLTVNIKSIELFDADLVITDMTGRVMQRVANQRIHLGENNFTLATKNLSKGVYNVVLYSDKGVKNQRVVVF